MWRFGAAYRLVWVSTDAGFTSGQPRFIPTAMASSALAQRFCKPFGSVLAGEAVV